MSQSVRYQNISCSGIEEELINCSTIPVDQQNYYDCYQQTQSSGYFYYATAHCISGIYIYSYHHTIQ